MGNCFTNAATQNIVLQITPPPPPPADGEHGKPAEPKPSGRPPLLPNTLPGSTPACGVVGWSMLDVWSLYILERELWSGQFWTAYLCTERATGLKYVCKSASKLPGAYVVGYMRREAAILQRLSGQPNVAKFRAAFEDADSLHLVMEFCSGGELFNRVTAKGSYPERQAAAVCRDVLTVVHVCHSMGVMHRDLRPENFRLANSAEGAPLKAIGFGLSVFIEEGKVHKDIVGSAYYVAPEVLLGNYGREIDVWSAGVILYILLCGWAPFWAETEKGIFDAILVGQVDLGSSPWPTISESAKDLIRQMLNRNPHRRITAAQALDHPWLKDGGASDRPTDSAVLLGMKQLKDIKKLKLLAPKETAEDLPPEEVKGLKQMFDNTDTDKGRAISDEELKIGLTKLGSKISETEVQKLMEEVDVDKSDNIDHMEFLSAMMDKHKMEKEQDFLPASQHLDKDISGEHGEKDASRVSKRSKSSGRKNDKKETEQELNKPVNDNVVMTEVPSSQDELDRKHEEELRKKMLAQKLAGGSGVNSSGNDEQHVQDNSMQEMGAGVGNTEREANDYKDHHKNHVEVEDVTDDKHTQQIQGMNQDTVMDTNESASGTSPSGRDREEVNSTQGIAGTDKEYFGDEARRRTDTDPKMMDKAVERIKAKNLEAVPEHPWLKEGGASDRPIDSAVLLRMKQFKEMNKLKQLALKGTAEDPPEEVKGLKQMFDNMDTDKSGAITDEELKIGLTKLGSKIDEAEVQKLMETVDADKSGSINDTEFLPAMVNKHKLENEEDFLPASQHLDKDNSGHRAHGEKDASRGSKRSKRSGRKNDKKEAEQELNKPVNHNVAMAEVSSSQAELDKKLEEELRRKMLSQKLAGRSRVNSSVNNERHIQDNNMQEMGAGVGNTEREANNYKDQDKNHVEVEDVTDDKHTQQIQGMNQDTVIDTNESASRTSTGGRDGFLTSILRRIGGDEKESTRG